MVRNRFPDHGAFFMVMPTNDQAHIPGRTSSWHYAISGHLVGNTGKDLLEDL
jgi:hypothetical protein